MNFLDFADVFEELKRLDIFLAELYKWVCTDEYVKWRLLLETHDV